MDDLIAEPRYRGVRGWLLFLCITLTILRPLKTMATHGASGEDIWHPNVPMIFDLAIAAWSVYVGICMWRVRPKAVTKVRVFLWSLTGLNVLLAVLIFCSPGDYPDGQSKAFLSCIGIVLWSTAWLAYLDTSKRVKATYIETEPWKGQLLRDMEEAMEEADNVTTPIDDGSLSPEMAYFQEASDCIRALGDRGDLAIYTQLYPEFFAASVGVYRAGFECFVPATRVADLIADAAYLYQSNPNAAILCLERIPQQWARISPA